MTAVERQLFPPSAPLPLLLPQLKLLHEQLQAPAVDLALAKIPPARERTHWRTAWR